MCQDDGADVETGELGSELEISEEIKKQQYATQISQKGVAKHAWRRI